MTPDLSNRVRNACPEDVPARTSREEETVRRAFKYAGKMVERAITTAQEADPSSHDDLLDVRSTALKAIQKTGEARSTLMGAGGRWDELDEDAEEHVNEVVETVMETLQPLTEDDETIRTHLGDA